MGEQNRGRESQGHAQQENDWRGNQRNESQNDRGRVDPADEGGSFREEGSYGYQGGYDEAGEEEEEEQQPGMGERANSQRASRSGYETGYQGGRGGEYPNYGDEGSFGGASDQRSAYGATSGTRNRDEASSPAGNQSPQ